MRICLIGDIHLYRLTLWPWHLIGKRILGQTNLWLSRRLRFKRHLMQEVVETAMSCEADMFAFSGDLTTTSLKNEFKDVKRLLEPIMQQYDALVVPGNHDAYTFAAHGTHRLHNTFPDAVPQKYPHFRMLSDNWFALAVNSSWPRVFTSRGKLGGDQLTRVAQYLSTVEPHQGVVVLCHYPIYVPATVKYDWNHRLADGPQLRTMVEQCPGRIVFLHGHIHRPWCYRPTEPAARHVLAINAGAPCYCDAAYPVGQGFWTIDLPHDARESVRAAHHFRDAEGVWQTSHSAEPR